MSSRIENEKRRWQGSHGLKVPKPRSSNTSASAKLQSSLESVRGNVVEWVLFLAFLIGLAWTPYYYGSNVLWTWGVNAILFPGLAVAYEVALLARAKHHPVAIKEIALPAALFLAVACWIMIQNATWTPSTWHHPIWAMAAQALEQPVQGTISVNRDLTALALLRLMTAAAVFWLALQLCRNRARADLLMMALVTIVAAYSAYGLLTFVPAQPENSGAPIFVTSTYFSRSHFSTYAGIGLITVCALIFRIYEREFIITGDAWRLRFASFIDATGPKTLLLLSGAFVILVALVLTGSRGGVIATIIGLFVLGILTLWQHKGGSRGVWGVLVFVAVILGATVLMFGDAILGQLTEKGLYDTYRAAVATLTIRSIFDAPLLGYGYGTFADVFPMFRDRSISVQGKWEQAHNTYLEVLQGLGLLFGSMLLVCVFLLLLKCFRAAIIGEGATVSRIAASVAMMVGAQSMVDFSLQIQAVALTFIALLGAGVAQSQSPRLVRD